MYKEELEINIIFIVLFGVIFLVILTLVLLFMTFSNRKNNIIQANLEAALKNQKRQHQLELKALRGQMNPHFVHNSLNAIQYYIQKNDVETSETYLAKFSKLMRQFFDYSRQQQITISDEIALLKNYLQIEKLRFEEKLEYAITIDSQLEVEEEYLPSMLLQPIVENAINHGLFHKKGKGKVTIDFCYLNENSFKVTIIDNGIGINNTKKLNKNFIKNTTSHSSEVLKERIYLLKESGLWNIHLNIYDRSKNHEQTGTEVSLIFNQNSERNEN